MNVAALKQGLANRGLGVGGNKAELASRLLAQVGGVQQVQADAQPPPAVAAKQPKYKWVDIADHTFTPRTPYAGSDLPKLHADFANLTTENRPHEWFKLVDAPEEEYHESPFQKLHGHGTVMASGHAAPALAILRRTCTQL